jgi:hypothetical protein
MKLYSWNGTGLMMYGVHPDEEGRVGFTVWLCLLFLPLIPLSSWSGKYIGEAEADGLFLGGAYLTDLQRCSHDHLRNLQTFLGGIGLALLAVLPAAVMIHITNHRKATNLELVALFAAAFWAVGIILYVEHRRKRLLKRRFDAVESARVQSLVQAYEVQHRERILAERTRNRRGASIFAIVAGALMAAFGGNWVFAGTPIRLSWFGGLLVIVGVLGLCGVNVWKGGPLDKRRDDDLERGD